jgi:hypothetical protein
VIAGGCFRSDSFRPGIIFDDGIGAYAQSSVEDIQDAIGKVSGSRIPLIRILDGYGEELWVNADHIRAIQRGNVVPLETGLTRTDADEEERPGRLRFRLGRHDR